MTVEISALQVKQLRDRTSMPFGDCKAALVATGGDMEKAVEHLRKTHKEAVDKRAGRETAEGRIGVHIDDAKQVGGIIEVRCESAPVAKSEQFVQLANDLARQVAFKGAASPEELLAQPLVDDPFRTVQDRISEVVGLIRENMRPARLARLTGLLGSYVHHDGTVGVLLQVEAIRPDAKADPQLLREVCMHITARNPLAALREHVPQERIDKEREIAQSQIAADPKNQGKPANILQRISEGKMNTWFQDNVLVDQPFVKDDSKSVGELLRAAGFKLVRFVRYKVGELSS
jgi:elongation factor Ts